MAVGACGSDDDGGGEVSGDHYRYVVSTLSTMATNKLDIDGNGRTENKLGELLQGLSTFPIQATIDETLARGSVLLLADVQTTSFSGASAAGFSVYLGDSATTMPAPCTDNTMLATCGQHLKGTGTFTVAATSPRDAQLTGPFAGGTLKAGPGKLSLQLALSGTPVTVGLIGAQVQIGDVSADGINRGIFGGGVTQAELDSVVLPAVVAQIKSVVDRDCGPESERTLRASDNTCGRTPVGGSFTPCMDTGATVLAPSSGFDTAPAPRDCKVSLAELKAHPLLGQALTPDVMVNGQAAVSAVLGFTAKKATFTP